MSGTDEWIDKLIAAGCMPKVAASVVTEVFVAGVHSAAVDKAGQKRRDWDREYRKNKRKQKRPPESGGNPVDATHGLWTEGVGLLRQLEVPERSARSNIGLWLKTQTPELVFERIKQAHSARIGQPIPWITRSFGAKNGKCASPVSAAIDGLIAKSESAGREGDPDPADFGDFRPQGR